MRIGAAWKNVLARLTADPDIGDGQITVNFQMHGSASIRMSL
jgi:hypothetical protein